ncbi:MAG: ROK family protein [Lachnospiraceae bacterium]|nr:ROK family protein [Lachnospiraceae bacterium]
MNYGALEAGGTKMVCAIGDENGKILEQVSIPTTEPKETIDRMIDYFKDKEIEALGVACFGPVDLRKDSPTYGYITSTPKPGWANTDLLGPMVRALKVPAGFDLDVNGSLLGEVTYGASKGLTDAVYFTVGTGIGSGVMTNGKLLHGIIHPEGGHIQIKHHPKDTFGGRCPFHKDCLEGMANGPSLIDRWGKPGNELKEEPLVWEIEAYYLAQAARAVSCLLSPQRIIFGGGVMHQKGLIDEIRDDFKEMMNGYLRSPYIEDIENYITEASLNDDQGIMGCIKLAIDAAAKAK